MSLINPADYYADRDVEHSAQGDVHLDLPFVVATAAEVDEAPRGARKRPDDAGVVDVAIRPPLRAPGIVCSYTCGFTAQPPGQPGYSHPFRLVAPIMGLAALKALGVKPNELRKLKSSGFIQGLMYIPLTELLRLDEPTETGSSPATAQRCSTDPRWSPRACSTGASGFIGLARRRSGSWSPR